jgi:hypothetical protein
MDVHNVVMLCAVDTVMYVSVLVLGCSIRRQTMITKCIQRCNLLYILNMEKPRSVPWNILTDELNTLNAELNSICHLLILLGDLTFMGKCNVSISNKIQNCSTCFGWYFHPSSGAHTTVSTAFDICHTVTAICRYRGRVGTGLSVLLVAAGSRKVINALSTKDDPWRWP